MTTDYEAIRPFRFEDLDGQSEPTSWGPVYPKTASAAVTAWRARDNLSDADKRAYGAAVHDWIRTLNTPKRAPNALSTASACASGQAGEFCAKAYRATLRARLDAAAARDKRDYADGKIAGLSGLKIKEAYRAAMTAKRARLARAAMREAA